MKQKTQKILQAIFILAAIISGIFLLTIFVHDWLSIRYWKGIKEKKASSIEVGTSDVIPSLQALYAENQDMIGWIKTSDGHIDFPVMQTKSDPEYYLRRNFDREDYSRGVPFADYRCSVVPEQGFNTIIYGHYTDSDDMFRWLLNYEGYKWYKDHKYIQFDTLYEEGTYEVVSVFFLDGTDAALMEDWDSTRADAYEVYNFIDIESKEDFKKFADNLKSLSLYKTQKELSIDSPIITIICCAPYAYSGMEKNGRFVVVAQKK